MKNHLIDCGIPEEKIIMEDKSTSTAENFKYSKRVLEKIENDEVKVLVITNDFHIYRSMQLAKKNDIDVIGVFNEFIEIQYFKEGE